MGIAFVAYVAIAWSRARGIPWLGWTIAVSVLSVWLGFALVQRHRQSKQLREARWERAIYEARGRARAIAEVKRAVKKLEPVRQAGRAEHARLSVLLAELLDADGDYAAATRAVDEVVITALDKLDAGLVRHTRAVTHLRASDPEGALRALDERTPSGDLELDQRLDLLEAYARIELGDVDAGLARAEAISHLAAADPSVITEARVVRAAALDAKGRREEALVALAALGRESLAPLAELGHPRVRALAKVALDSAAA